MKKIKCNETRIKHIFIKYLGTAILALLILFSSTASASVINGTQISGGSSRNPDIYGNKIVWEEIQSSGMDENYFIYMYDISNSQKTEIPGGLLAPCQINPAIYENRIIWNDFRNGDNIYMYDISTSQETPISANGGAASIPDIYSDRIVYVNSVDPYGICVYNLSTKDETHINTSTNARDPAIYDDKIVWQDYRNGGWNIFMYNLSTSKETQISTSGSAYSPEIYGNRIVWENKGLGSKICMFDLSISLETQISNGFNPAIYGDRIVWEDETYYSMMDNGGFGMYNISTRQKISIHTNNPVVNPSIYGNRIVCEDNPGDRGRIWLYTISEEDMKPIFPVANFSTNISSGNVPLTVKFTDLSGNVSGWFSGWKWNFGDGATSTEQNPIHTYSKAGIYIVKLTVSNEQGTDSKLATITVLEKSITPVANFSTNVTGGFAPLSVQFTDLSKNSTSRRWNFGDGTNSTLQNPVHIYSKTGNFTVNLTAINPNGTNSKTAIITVSAKQALPAANFTSNFTSGIAPLSVAFTDKSTNNPTAWKWNFGDGTNSTAKNPIHKYSTKGNYTVSLIVTNAAGSNTTTKINYIKVLTVVKPVTNFTGNVTSGTAPLKVLFTDKSTNNPTAWKWTFGDGTNSTIKNPIHKYSAKGNYTVSLTASNSAGSSTTTKTNYIRVSTIIKPVANFTSNLTSGYSPLTVAFTDKSTNNPTSWRWTFGDGTNSTFKNPVHRYSTAGNYTVALTASNSAGSNTITKTNCIKAIKR